MVILEWPKASNTIFGYMFFFNARVAKALGTFGATVEPRRLSTTT